ncbi:MAG: Octanoyltransferase [Smithella sp. PtaU1.Bin162]|nr:MAG: Octanoyltransferase [Smithella sp. PtaU1.Bin162]
MTGYCLEIGIEEYGKAFALQKRLNRARRNNTIPDTVVLLEHRPCFTVGRKGGFDHILVSNEILAAEGIQVYETDRGGDITYHGPGQLVCYPIFDLNGFGCDVHSYVRRMEDVLIGTLKNFGITADRRKDYPGVWVGAAKIGAEGIGVEQWVTMHGVALNVCPDLRHFSFIVPCGIYNLGVTSMAEHLGYAVNMNKVKKEVCSQLSAIFQLTLENVSLEKIMKITEGHVLHE